MAELPSRGTVINRYIAVVCRPAGRQLQCNGRFLYRESGVQPFLEQAPCSLRDIQKTNACPTGGILPDRLAGDLNAFRLARQGESKIDFALLGQLVRALKGQTFYAQINQGRGHVLHTGVTEISFGPQRRTTVLSFFTSCQRTGSPQAGAGPLW